MEVSATRRGVEEGEGGEVEEGGREQRGGKNVSFPYCHRGKHKNRLGTRPIFADVYIHKYPRALCARLNAAGGAFASRMISPYAQNYIKVREQSLDLI